VCVCVCVCVCGDVVTIIIDDGVARTSMHSSNAIILLRLVSSVAIRACERPRGQRGALE
jgi:hypothetical protein